MAVLDTCKKLEEDGFEVTYLDVDEYGRINLDELKSSIRKDTILISIMYANNEVGTIQQISQIGKIAKENNITFPKVNYNNKTYKRWRINDKGYVVISIGNDTYELEHRIVVQNYILRPVSDKESIHHINGNQADNRPCNLVLLDKRLHDAFHTYCRDNNFNHVEQSVYHILSILNYKIRVEMYAELIRIYEV